MVQGRQHSLSTEHLWPLIVLAAFGCLGALIPIGPLDFWWHMAIGRDIAQTGSVPRIDTYSWTLPSNTPFFYQSWLSEWLFFQLHSLGGLSLIVLLRNVLLLLAYALIGLDTRRRSGSWRMAALAIAGAGLMTLNNLTVRPQMFSWLPFALTVALLGAYRGGNLPRRWLLLVPLIMSLWVNLHGAFAIGLGLIAVTLAGETLKFVLSRWRPLSHQRFVWLAFVSLLSFATMVINPRGFGILGYVSNLVGNPAVRQLVIEWQSPDLLAFPGILIPLAVVLAALGWLKQRQRFDPTDALVLLAFTYLAANSARNLIWFGMVAWPIVAGLLRRGTTLQKTRPVRVPLVNYGIAVSLCLPLLVVQPPLKGTLDLPPVFAGWGSSVPEGSLIDGSTPVETVRWLQQHPLPADARLFHDMGYGSYLMWALPNVRLCADPRIELYPLDYWQRYQRIARGENARAELQSLGATHALLSRANQPELISDLSQPDSGWMQLYADDHAIIFEQQ